MMITRTDLGLRLLKQQRIMNGWLCLLKHQVGESKGGGGAHEAHFGYILRRKLKLLNYRQKGISD